MSYTYATRKRNDDSAPKKETAPAQPSMDALRSGASQPTQEQMGHRVDLPDAMRAKMENAFGADLGAVKLYESQAVADAGAKAVTRGSDIAFAPGMLDFTSYGGQALLGHELSHVVSQARGEVTGGGFLNDRALEARADREGAMAASGQTVAMPTAAMSGVTAAAAAGPMQAKGKDKNIPISAPTGGRKMDSKKSSGSSELLKNLGGVAKGGANEIAPQQQPGVQSVGGTVGGVSTDLAPQPLPEGNVLTSAFNAAGTLTEKGAGLNDKVESIKNAPETYEKVNSMAQDVVYGRWPGSGAKEKEKKTPAKSFETQLRESVAAANDPSGLERFSQGSNAANKVLKTLGSVKNTTKSLAGVQEAVDAGDHHAVTDAMIDSGDSALSMGETAADTVDTIAKMKQDPKALAALTKAKSANKTLSEDQMKALGLNPDTVAKTKKAMGVSERAGQANAIIGTIRGGVQTFKALGDARDASKRQKALGESIGNMRQRMGPRTKDDEDMLQSFEQSQTSAGIDKYKARMKALTSGLDTAANVSTLAGAPPALGAVLTGASKVVGTWGDMKADYKTDQFHKETVDKAEGVQDMVEALKKDKRFSGMSEKRIRRAVLRSKGAGSGKDDEMFQSVSQRRAKNIVQKAKAGNADAQTFAANNRFDFNAKNAERTAEKRLGLEEVKEYHDASAFKYNEFKEDSDKNQKWKDATALMTGGQKAKYFLQQTGKDIGTKLQTGGKKALLSAKNALGGLKHIGGKVMGGLKNAGVNAINFMVDSGTREEALKSMKTGAGNAAKKVGEGFKKFGAGAKKAGINAINFMVDPNTRAEAMKKAGASMRTNMDVVKHAVSKKVEGVSDWYHQGVDQLNINRGSYENMNAFDRFKWSMKNLPARIMAGTERGQNGTWKREAELAQEEAAVQEYMEEQEKKKKAASGG